MAERGPGAESHFLRGARAVASSLSLRLFLSVATVIVAAFTVYAWVTFRAAAREYRRALYEGAERVGDLIQQSTHYGMLVNQKGEVHHVIQAMARTPDVEGVRIYDKNGSIIFSADSAEIGRSVDLHAEACVSCHGSGTPLRSVPAGDRVRIFQGPHGRIMGVINAIENSRECARSGCHVSTAEQSILGVLDVRMSLAKPDQRLAVMRRQAIAGAVIVTLLAGAVSALFILRVVRRPVRRLIAGVDRVAAGDLDAEIPLESGNEIGQLARSFNDMTRQLRQARKELTQWSGQLERHLQEKTAELTRTQREIAHMDKTASLGKLAATVAHELNNPLAGILNYAKLTARTLRESRTKLAEEREIEGYLTLIQREADRCGVIVRSLLTFARPGGAEMGPHALTPILQRALMLVRHHLEISNIRLEARPLGGDDRIVCDADQLEQALVALLVNAVEAMPQGGTLSVGAEATDGEIRLSIADTGLGIAPDAVEHIFEPFYSTKERQEGVGLGLAVVHGIVQRHGGRIQVESELNKGTKFQILLPRRPPRAGEDRGGEGPATIITAAGGSA
ncbi:MAG TPA: ATP-binding protein [Candidatus Eisenbacteria bacterium]|jgi:two-component system NtrC family sensor kinase